MKLFLNKKMVFMVFGIVLIITILVSLILFIRKEKTDASGMLSYDTVINNKTNSYVGKKITWTGKIASNLTQVDGIKLLIIDSQHPVTVTTTNWFWVIPKDEPASDDVNGSWIMYMLKRYGDININDVDTETKEFKVTGTLLESDCTFYDNGKCVPNLEVEKIEKL